MHKKTPEGMETNQELGAGYAKKLDAKRHNANRKEKGNLSHRVRSRRITLNASLNIILLNIIPATRSVYKGDAESLEIAHTSD